MTHIRHGEKVFFMRIFLSVLILIFSFQSLTKADDIRDFQIEGMSIGDSLLDFFSETEIKSNIKTQYYEYKKNFQFIAIEIQDHESFEKYFGVQIHVKKKDSTFKIYGISGFNFCQDNVDDCYDMQKKIEKDFLIIFNNVKVKQYTTTHPADSTGKSKVKTIDYEFNNGDAISINVYNWSNAMPHVDNYDVSIDTFEFLKAL